MYFSAPNNVCQCHTFCQHGSLLTMMMMLSINRSLYISQFLRVRLTNQKKHCCVTSVIGQGTIWAVQSLIIISGQSGVYLAPNIVYNFAQWRYGNQWSNRQFVYGKYLYLSAPKIVFQTKTILKRGRRCKMHEFTHPKCILCNFCEKRNEKKSDHCFVSVLSLSRWPEEEW